MSGFALDEHAVPSGLQCTEALRSTLSLQAGDVQSAAYVMSLEQENESLKQLNLNLQEVSLFLLPQP